MKSQFPDKANYQNFIIFILFYYQPTHGCEFNMYTLLSTLFSFYWAMTNRFRRNCRQTSMFVWHKCYKHFVISMYNITYDIDIILNYFWNKNLNKCVGLAFKKKLLCTTPGMFDVVLSAYGWFHHPRSHLFGKFFLYCFYFLWKFRKVCLLWEMKA